MPPYLESLGHLGGEHWELGEGEMSRGDCYAFAIGQLGAISFDEFLKFLERDRTREDRPALHRQRRAISFCSFVRQAKARCGRTGFRAFARME
jgi:hypothetical protein